MQMSEPVPATQGLRSVTRRWALFAIVSLLATIAAMFATGEWSRTRALADLNSQSMTDANLKLALLMAVLERPRALPLVLAADAELIGALSQPDTASADRLNRKLEVLARETEVSVIYVVGKDGLAISASNWREPTSFVGNDYSFRDYFTRAVENGNAEQYALGNVSKRPGLYLSRRVIDAKGEIVGIVVVKVEFDQLERSWAQSGRPTYVLDKRGIVLITSVPSWRFMATGPIAAEEKASIRDSLQFGDAALTALPFQPGKERADKAVILAATMPGDTGKVEFLQVALAAPGTDWTLHQLAPLGAVLARGAREGRLLALSIMLPIIAIAAFVLARRFRATRRIAENQANQLELERRVVARTVDLTLARDSLQQEIADHRTTEQRLQTVQHELVQANRLAILGQVAAGVAHEINQPVATIRAYADNARTFLDRGRIESAWQNMETISALTERIGTITEELKAFARKGRTSAGPTCLRDVITGALMLLRSRFSGRLDQIEIALPREDLHVVGNRIRLEQILINLLQNSLEAIEGREGGRIAVSVQEDDGDVALVVCDNGSGFAPGIEDALFTPFNTSKEGGLGLGLVISKEIVTDYGGSIEVSSKPGETKFIVHLKGSAP